MPVTAAEHEDMTDTAEDAVPDRAGRRRGLPAVGLFLLSPLFGEYLLGNLKVSDLALLPFLALMYGAGALLIRETARRSGRGSATMLILGVAYALVEEGLIDQMLFNQHYFVGQSEGSDTYIGAFGVDASLTIIVVAMHAIWSTYIPITIVESLVPDRRARPWLGPVGIAVTASVFAGGSAWLGWETYRETGFLASEAQVTGASLVVAGLVVAAFLVPQRVGGPPPSGRPAPRVWIAGLSAFAMSSLFMLTETLPGWLEVAAALLLMVVFAVAVLRWSSRPGFGERHRLGLVAGGVLTYAWLGLTMEPETGPRSMNDQVGGVLIAGFALALTALAVRRSTAVDNGPAGPG
ncbi:hypothetical protein AB0J72_26205 [Dactylosporangium sp. NPDC049742]|uniref:hypothetical protein n=1 Tax=Dactylosporangium sp. NPDC049742 TaxID=3154737 RepID=UPI003426ED8F